jgi:hypothetical protein
LRRPSDAEAASPPDATSRPVRRAKVRASRLILDPVTSGGLIPLDKKTAPNLPARGGSSFCEGPPHNLRRPPVTPPWLGRCKRPEGGPKAAYWDSSPTAETAGSWTFLAMSKLTGAWTGSAADASLTPEEVAAVPEVFVDYSLVGHARRFRTRVKASVRRQLQVGDTVVVPGGRRRSGPRSRARGRRRRPRGRARACRCLITCWPPATTCWLPG